MRKNDIRRKLEEESLLRSKVGEVVIERFGSDVAHEILVEAVQRTKFELAVKDMF